MWGLISKSHLNHNLLITNHKRQSIRTPVITACHLTSSDSQGWSLLLLITKLFLQLPKYVLFRKIVISHFKMKSKASTFKIIFEQLNNLIEDLYPLCLSYCIPGIFTSIVCHLPINFSSFPKKTDSNLYSSIETDRAEIDTTQF